MAGAPFYFLGVSILANEMKLATEGSHNPADFFRSAYFKAKFWKDNPRYFYPEGIWVFCGPQGSGKTLSAVQTVQHMSARYPYAKVCSNMEVRGLGVDVIPFEGYDMLSSLDNGTDGVIFLLDELHVLWNSLESRNVPVSEMAAFCQMRKARRVIVGTSQVYGRIAKPIREQLKYVFDCHNYFGLIQVNDRLDPTESIERDGHIAAVSLGRTWFFHTPELYRSYETLNKIERLSR